MPADGRAASKVALGCQLPSGIASPSENHFPSSHRSSVGHRAVSD